MAGPYNLATVQQDLFSESSEAPEGASTGWRRLALADADVRLFDQVFDAAESQRLFDALRRQAAWSQHRIRMMGKTVACPRLSAWYGDAGVEYEYSGLPLSASGWIDPLSVIRRRVEHLAGQSFNSVLLNLYRDGRDSMGWHSDDERSLGVNPVIASVSLGAVRRFKLRPRLKSAAGGQLAPAVTIDLPDGSLLLMAGATQHHWHHALPKTQRQVGERINLTFRQIQNAVS